MIVRIRLRCRKPGARFVHPMDPMPRTAILAPGFRETKLVRVFPSGWNDAANRFHPASIAGPVEQLRRLARQGVCAQHSIVVFSFDGEEALTNADRDLFWKAFGVPVFEQLLSPTRQLLATECDAHDGLHLVGNFENLRAGRSMCPCGNPAPRLARQRRVEELAELLA